MRRDNYFLWCFLETPRPFVIPILVPSDLGTQPFWQFGKTIPITRDFIYSGTCNCGIVFNSRYVNVIGYKRSRCIPSGIVGHVERVEIIHMFYTFYQDGIVVTVLKKVCRFHGFAVVFPRRNARGVIPVRLRI